MQAILFLLAIALGYLSGSPAFALQKPGCPFAAGAVSCGEYSGQTARPIGHPNVFIEHVGDPSTVPDGWREVPFVETAPEPRLTPDETARGFLLFTRPITEPVYPTTRPYTDERIRSLDIFATPGEFEPATVGVWPARDMRNLRVRVSPLHGEAGTIPASAADVRLVTYWNIRYPSYQSEGTYRRLPELLERATIYSGPARESIRWWIRIHIPANARPGMYLGVVTVRDDLSGGETKVPLNLRVLGFRLKKDPNKRYSAYYYIQRLAPNLAPEKRAFILKSSSAEYRAMTEYGLDMIPTLYLRMDQKNMVYLDQPGEIEHMRKAGLQGPIPVTADNVVRAVYRETVPDGAVGPHWAVGTMPPEAFYAKVTEAFVRFERERRSNGWPEFIYCPIDEVNVGAKEFGSRVYAALKKAGVRTYITKDPKSPDAPAYAPAVDFWCSQPFSVPYEQVISGKAGYWCYPNHNAGEIKEPVVMCKGGRMTYGYGFWRSGYTVIIPWHWRWQSGPDPFDYLRGSATSGCGVRLDDDGEVIPTPYWECFCEGYDDARYLYTLQSAIVEREGSSDPKLRKLAEEGKNLLQEIWSSIRVREKYLDEGLWASNDFDIVRWRVAKLAERLISFPAFRKAAAPSVLVADTAARAPEDPPVEPGPGDEALDLGDEDFSCWRSGTAEGTVSMTETAPFQGSKALRFVIAVDHAKDGGEGGNYPVGWPRLTTEFSDGSLDLTRWDILSFAVRADRARGNSLVLSTPFSVNARAAERGVAADRTFDLGDRIGVWTPLRIPISDLISARLRPPSPWKSTRTLQFSVAESRFPDGARITLDFDSVALVRFAEPRISGLTAPRWIVPNRPVFTISFDLLGASSVTPGSHIVRAVLVDHSGKHVADTSANLAANRRIVLEVGALPPGTYRLRVEITDQSGKVCSAEEREVLGVEGW